MENLYHQTNKLIQEVQRDLGSYERAAGEFQHTIRSGWGIHWARGVSENQLSYQRGGGGLYTIRRSQ